MTSLIGLNPSVYWGALRQSFVKRPDQIRRLTQAIDAQIELQNDPQHNCYLWQLLCVAGLHLLSLAACGVLPVRLHHAQAERTRRQLQVTASSGGAAAKKSLPV
jgi:hypothetical protein